MPVHRQQYAKIVPGGLLSALHFQKVACHRCLLLATRGVATLVLMKNYDFRGRTVLLTGASKGLGAEFARALSQQGARLVLLARGRAELEALAQELGGAHVLVEDLARPGAARRVFDAVNALGLEVDVLINNAGFGAHGPFTALSLEMQRDELEVNVGALVELTHLFLPGLERRQGGVLNVASTAAFQPVPFMAVYAASKAFVLSFSEALWAEYQPRGVRVVALCPGATDTAFFARAGEAAAFGARARPEDVVRLGLDAFRSNRASVVHGAGNRFVTLLTRLAPRAFTARLSGRLMRPQTLALGAG